MQSSDPALKIKMGFPDAHDILSVFVKLHLESERIIRAAGKAVIPLILHTFVRIPYLFHIRLLCGFKTLGVLGDLELVEDFLDGTVHEHRKIVHGVVDTMVGHT